jgi:hypothetical protein
MSMVTQSECGACTRSGCRAAREVILRDEWVAGGVHIPYVSGGTSGRIDSFHLLEFTPLTYESLKVAGNNQSSNISSPLDNMSSSTYKPCHIMRVIFLCAFRVFGISKCSYQILGTDTVTEAVIKLKPGKTGVVGSTIVIHGDECTPDLRPHGWKPQLCIDSSIYRYM